MPDRNANPRLRRSSIAWRGILPRSKSGFTALELIMVISIVLILCGLVYTNAGTLLASAQQVVCASRMRTLHAGISSYMQDHQMVWPQGPQPQKPGWASFWVTALEPYEVTRKTWQCPVIAKWTQGNDDPELSLHYVPTDRKSVV